MLIDSINSPTDIKKLDTEQLIALAAEIRKGLMNRLSKRGGHVGPNLGIVETTIALHYVFDSPRDKFVFDVSHQCYTHKILTGRKKLFSMMLILKMFQDIRIPRKANMTFSM